MSDILRKFRRGATLLGELIKYEAAALCAGVLKVTNPRYRHVWLVSERGREARIAAGGTICSAPRRK